MTVPADTKAGLFTEKVRVKTSSAKAPDVLISVYASVQPMVQIVPERLEFGTVTGDAPVARPVILVNNRRGAQLGSSPVSRSTIRASPPSRRRSRWASAGKSSSA